MILSLNGIIAGRGVIPSTLLTNLLSVYKAESNANDSYGTVNGTAQGGLTYTTGKSGNAFNFNGTNAYVSYPDNSFNFTGDYSINLWIYFPSSPAGAQYDVIQSVRQNSINTGWKFVIRQGKPEFQIYNNSSQFVAWYTAGLDLVANTWYNLSIVKKTGQAPTIMSNGSYYTVGVRASNSSITEAQYTTPCYSVIGAAKYDTASLGNYMPSNSKLDEISLWNRALTTAEETELYRCGSGNFYPYISLPTLDSDACAFIGAASITDTTQQSAINQLVLDLKSANIWTKMKAIYPFVGGTASSHRFNLKDPRPVASAFYLNFYGGGTHSLSGYQPDGATAYADTNLFPDIHLSPNSGFGFYSITNNSLTSSEMGALYYDMPSVTNERSFQSVRTATVMYMGVNSNNVLSFSDTDSRGFYQAYRTDSSTIKTLKNTTLYTASSQYYIMPSMSCYIGARNERYLAQVHSNKGLSFAYFQNNFTDADATALYNAVQTFNTTLGNGRAV